MKLIIAPDEKKGVIIGLIIVAVILSVMAVVVHFAPLPRPVADPLQESQ